MRSRKILRLGNQCPDANESQNDAYRVSESVGKQDCLSPLSNFDAGDHEDRRRSEMRIAYECLACEKMTSEIWPGRRST